MEQEQIQCDKCNMKGGKLDVYDWLVDIPKNYNSSDIVEIQFKNTRKAYYRNSNGLCIKKGNIVAVEASPGHDIGTVTCSGEIALMQMRKNNLNVNQYEFKRLYRIAKPTDIEKWEEAKSLEHSTMIESRRISESLNLEMKIGDVEYQGDKTKAIFYYIADGRVDFRQLIKVLADRFKVRIEMRQIGARQEAGRIGGIGPCGRELCCSTWITKFVSVTTNAARYQELSFNPQKLAGQCGKLKCCLNFELDTYIDAQKDFPATNVPLETEDGTFYHFKTDIFKRTMMFSSDKEIPANLCEISVDKVIEIIEINSKGKKFEKLESISVNNVVKDKELLDYSKVVGEDSISRFNEPKNKKKRKNNNKKRKHNNNNVSNVASNEKQQNRQRQGNRKFNQNRKTENNNSQKQNKKYFNNKK